jgi:hypothetical protein
MVVHYVVMVVVDGNEVRPLCGDWAGSRSWTKIVTAVTCPRCRELLTVAGEGAAPESCAVPTTI